MKKKLLSLGYILCFAGSTTALNVNEPTHNNQNRRSFLQKAAMFAPAVTFLPQSSPAFAANGAEIVTQVIKVTPVAHTFVSSTSPNTQKVSVKPLRENDATRFLTNAKVVHVFYDGDKEKATKLMKEVLDLTVKRKKGGGAGVTPGNVKFLSNDADTSGIYKDIPGLSILNEAALKDALEKIPSEDVVIIPPEKSKGTVSNGMVVEKSAKTCGLEVGGQKSGGVISLLLNGPKDPEKITVMEGEYATSTILWYDV